VAGCRSLAHLQVEAAPRLQFLPEIPQGVLDGQGRMYGPTRPVFVGNRRTALRAASL
jgi:hypothetical protein